MEIKEENKAEKKDINHIFIVTSDAKEAAVKRFSVPAWSLRAALLAGCVLVGIVLGYFLYGNIALSKSKAAMNKQSEAYQAEIAALEEEMAQLEADFAADKEALTVEIEELTEKLNVLAETYTQATDSEQALQETLEQQAIPSGYPLTSGATMEINLEEDPILIFSAGSGTMVVATAAGTVIAVEEDETYGTCVWIDHGNGYITIYRNNTQASVRLGDSVFEGTTIFLISDTNTTVGYQMLYEETYIDPSEVLIIEG